MCRAAEIAGNTKCWIGQGCIIARNGTVLVEAFNETLKGEEFCQEFRNKHKNKKHDIHCNCGNEGCSRKKLELSGGRGLEVSCSVHAEADAIAKAAREGISVESATMYVTSFPCLICMRSIVAAGIKKVVYMNDFYKPHHKELFKKNGVTVNKIPEGKVWKDSERI